MKVLNAAFTSAFFTATFTQFGAASALHSGRPLWAGAAVAAVLGLLIGTGAAYSTGRK